ncbi:DUF1420 family protein [Methylibium sp.]|uniref:DUF1420 family protein n=1 Tax=Methylibium sp. TaxID=2067992 RepID=UPI003D10DE2A
MTAIFGLEAAVLSPPYSAIVSLLMFVGVFALGLRVSGWLDVRASNTSGWEFFVAPVVGATVLAAMLYPLMLFGLVNATGLSVVAILLALHGLWALGRAVPGFSSKIRASGRSYFASLFRWQAMPYWLLLGLGLVALGPSTNADSLNYHLGVALQFLHDGVWPVSPEWFHSRLAGAGEGLIALGLSIGAEQFSSLLQWSGIFCLCGLLQRYPDSNNPILTPVTLALVSSPVLLFLVNADKPQLVPIAMTSTALALTLYPTRRSVSRRSRLLGFGLVCLLVMTASQMKLNFLVSGGIVGVIAFALMARSGLAVPAGLMALGGLACIVLPPAIWKHLHFGGTLADAFLKPFPGDWPGYDAFTGYLRNYRDSSMWFPLSLVLPARPGAISTVVGVGVGALAWLRPAKDIYCWLAIAAATAVTIVGTLFGQANARFYLEPFVWVLMALAMQAPRCIHDGAKLAQCILGAQVLMFMALISYAVVRSIPGAMSTPWRNSIMATQADGYTVMKQVDAALPADAVLISAHPSVALSPRKVFASDWISFTGSQPADWAPYLQRLQEGRVTHALVIGEPSRSPFAKCFSGVEAGPISASKATRNPLNSGAAYAAWLMKIDRERMPSCFEK